MSEIRRDILFKQLNALAYRTIESATVFCKMRGNAQVELVHWLHQILQEQDSDLHHILRHFGVDEAHLASDLTRALEQLPRGARPAQDLSPQVDQAAERGFVYARLLFGQQPVRTGHLLVGLVQTPELRSRLRRISKEFERLDVDALVERFDDLVKTSSESRWASAAANADESADRQGQPLAPPALGKQEALQRFTLDLTAAARRNELDGITGRESEIRKMVDVLMRRRQNNPILVGEAGVGKTAVVEGFAVRIAAGDVPKRLQNVTVRVLDVGLLQAGASMKGEFEQRLQHLLEEVQNAPEPIILFIDEAHTLIGAGGQAGTGDAANLLKPALARGTLRTIAATTWAEYKKFIEPDPALTRRFQTVVVDEPVDESAIHMMRNVAQGLSLHHGVDVLDDALQAAVRLSRRYIPARQLPDKAVSLLDTACARVAVSQHAVPAAIEDLRRSIESTDLEIGTLERESHIGIAHEERLDKARQRLAEDQRALAGLTDRWEQESRVVQAILSLRQRLTSEASGDAKPETITAGALEPASAASKEELNTLQAELVTLQGDAPLVLPAVTSDVVAAVIADWTGIPAGRMVKNEIDAVLNIDQTLRKRVIGQDHAMDALARRLQTSRAALEDPNKPIGVFMLVGPSGVGKTETALALAESLYGGDHNLITVNMSEFQEAHSVSTLKGAPPGYVGYGEGGVLTEAVRRKPYSVVLLDEVEKAHRDVHEIFFQVFDKGVMDDGQGRSVNFKNTLILLTSNVGSDLIMQLCAGRDPVPEVEAINAALRPELLRVFPAALLGRLVCIPYYPLSHEMLGNIVRLQLERIGKRVAAQHSIPFTFSDRVVEHIVGRCTELESGGRMVDAILTHHLLPTVSRELLQRKRDERPLRQLQVDVTDNEFTYRFD